MNRRETFVVGNIDRRREHAGAKQARSARTKALEARARHVLARAVEELPDDERPVFVENLARAMRSLLLIYHGEVTAASILAREAGAATMYMTDDTPRNRRAPR